MTRINVDLRTMQDVNGHWHVAAWLVGEYRRRTRRHERALSQAIKIFANANGPRAITGYGIDETMPEGYEPTVLVAAYASPSCSNEYAPAFRVSVPVL